MDGKMDAGSIESGIMLRRSMIDLVMDAFHLFNVEIAIHVLIARNRDITKSAVPISHISLTDITYIINISLIYH